MRLPTRTVALAAFLSLAGAGVFAVGAFAAETGVFELGSLNKRYDHLTSDLAPIETGGIKVQLSSPQHELSLLSNRLVLRPLGPGSYDLALQIEFGGSGSLIADLDVSGAASRLTDELVVPAQRRTVLAKVKIARSRSGYLITPLELPSDFQVEIESRLGSQLVAACRPLGLLMPLNCDDLERALTLVSIPMPAPGETYLFESERLAESERRDLDAYLKRTGATFLE